MNPQGINSWEGYSQGTLNNINLIEELRSPSQLPAGDRYDTLVITERHDILSTVNWESTDSLLRHFHDRLRESDSNGRTYFYQSWLSIDKSNPQAWIDYETNALMAWECVSSKANLTLQADGLSPNISNIAAGWAMVNMVQAALNGDIPGLEGTQQEILDQIFSDDVHLTSLGRLFVGAYTFGEIFNQSPENYPIPQDIADNTGRALLALAQELLVKYRHRNASQGHKMHACRTHIAQNVCEHYWDGIFQRPELVASCQAHFGQDVDGNPFRENSSSWVSWPAPE